MYHLIQCEIDKSLCVVKEQDVICDGKVVKNGDIVTFFWSNKEYIGQLLKRSEDFEFLKEEMKRMKQADKTLKKSQAKSPSTITTSLGKRKSVKPRSFSPSEANEQTTIKMGTQVKKGCKSGNPYIKKSKILHKKYKNIKLRSSSSNTLSSEDDESGYGKENVSGNSKHLSSSSTSSLRSPSKDDLKLKLLNYEKLLAEQGAIKPADKNNKPRTPEPSPVNSLDNGSQRVEDSDESLDSDKEVELPSKNARHESEDESAKDEIDNGDDSSQLFGVDYQGEEMIMLENGIYCKKKVYKQALGASHLATHVARKLLEGVFRNTALLKCTLSGRPVRSQGKERQNEEVSCMHEKARDAIINFSKKVAKQRHWTEQPDSKIKSALAQKLVEIKQRARKNAANALDPK